VEVKRRQEEQPTTAPIDEVVGTVLQLLG
jgi:hypothetical protein